MLAPVNAVKVTSVPGVGRAASVLASTRASTELASTGETSVPAAPPVAPPAPALPPVANDPPGPALDVDPGPLLDPAAPPDPVAPGPELLDVVGPAPAAPLDVLELVPLREGEPGSSLIEQPRSAAIIRREYRKNVECTLKVRTVPRRLACEHCPCEHCVGILFVCRFD